MFWQIYNNIATILIVSQLVFLVQSLRNFRYALKKARRKPPSLRQPTLLTVPCKGIDSAFDRNITSFFKLEYDNFHLHFVVEDESDPAYEKLCALKDNLAGASNAIVIKILVAGPTTGSSQKISKSSHSPIQTHASAPTGSAISSIRCENKDAVPQQDTDGSYPRKTTSLH